jgi:predicted component of viral defense system (DUF524 family)
MRIVGSRDIAALYEWWCFFQVVDAVTEKLGPPLKIDPARETWQGMELRQGLIFRFAASIDVKFNQGFTHSAATQHYSYSVPFRPDILIEAPSGRHIFDAKFAFQPIGVQFGVERDDADEEESPKSQARRWHIHKMHAYRDALDRVESVRVLYPGTTAEWYPVDVDDPQAGIGALPLRVEKSTDAEALKSLVADLVTSSSPEICAALAVA